MTLRDAIDAIDLIVPKLRPADHILITDSRELVGTSRDGPWRGFRETPGRRYERGGFGTSRDWLEVTGGQEVAGSNPASPTKREAQPAEDAGGRLPQNPYAIESTLE